MLLKTLISIHSKLSQSRDEIKGLGIELQDIEEAVDKYNSVRTELKIIENQINITESSLTNIKNIVETELKNLADLKSRISEIENIKEIKIVTLNANKIEQLTKDATNLLSDLDSIKAFLIKRANKIKYSIYGFLGLGAAGLGLNYQPIFDIIKSLLQ
jgi:predicted nuclease with TOPRIM domain